MPWGVVRSFARSRGRGEPRATGPSEFGMGKRGRELRWAARRKSSWQVFRIARAQQALFACLDTLAKVRLTCVPEPLADARPQGLARAKERYDRLIQSAGRTMVGESGLAMRDLVEGLQQH
jgi:hypothetical protein